MNDPGSVIACVESMDADQLRSVIKYRSSRWENRNAITNRARNIAFLISKRLARQAEMDVENAALRACREAGIRNTSDVFTVQAASRELVLATIVKEQLAAHEYQALVGSWLAASPEIAKVEGVGSSFMSQEVLVAQETKEREQRAEQIKPKPKPKAEARKSGEPRALRETKPVDRKLLGDPSNGVRIKPSKDHPGMFFLIEGKANRRVYSGYLKTQAAAEKVIKDNGWKSLGMVGQRERAELARPIVRQGGKATQTKQEYKEEQAERQEDEKQEAQTG